MSGNKKIPKGWMDYTNFGDQLPGTKFIPLKVPLKLELCRYRIPEEYWFTPQHVLEQLPRLKLIINLTNANNGRYYNHSDFMDVEIKVHQIRCEGHGILPPANKLNEFFKAVDNFMQSEGELSDGLIGVHCTHGLNRTGYFICKYLVNRMNMDPEAAIELFETARGHPIERQQYIRNIRGSSRLDANHDKPAESISRTYTAREAPVIENWRVRDASHTSADRYPSRQRRVGRYDDVPYARRQSNRDYGDTSAYSRNRYARATPNKKRYYDNTSFQNYRSPRNDQ